MDIVRIIMIVGAVLFAFVAGWRLGRTAPSWQIDSENQYDQRMRSRFWLFFNSHMYFNRFTSFKSGSLIVVILAFLSVCLAVFGWDETNLETTTGAVDQVGSEFQSLKTVLTLAIGIATGYIVSRLTDKGPMGPLE